MLIMYHMGRRPPTFRGGVIRYRKNSNNNKQPKQIITEPKTEVIKHPVQQASSNPEPTDTSSFIVVQQQTPSNSSYCSIQ